MRWLEAALRPPSSRAFWPRTAWVGASLHRPRRAFPVSSSCRSRTETTPRVFRAAVPLHPARPLDRSQTMRQPASPSRSDGCANPAPFPEHVHRHPPLLNSMEP